eukprot:4259-Pelagococcus_subviridis.AAC.1
MKKGKRASFRVRVGVIELVVHSASPSPSSPSPPPPSPPPPPSSSSPPPDEIITFLTALRIPNPTSSSRCSAAAWIWRSIVPTAAPAAAPLFPGGPFSSPSRRLGSGWS